MPAVSSSAIDRIEYDEPTSRLYVTFASGKTYTYYRVPRSIYERFLLASSKGTFFNDYIKDRYSVA
jgi:hypothetical protein